MLSVTEAKKLILEHTTRLPQVSLPLEQAAGMVLAEDVFSPLDIPAFPQASMDGYALSFEEWRSKKRLRIQGEVQAGEKGIEDLAPGNAARIFTGAVVPAGADTIVMQEKVKVENGELIVEDENLAAGINVRSKGSEIRRGELALPVNSILSPAAIGLLAAMGFTDVCIFPKPSITIIITGNELKTPGLSLQKGQAYDSNSYALKALLKQFHFEDRVKVFFARDSLGDLVECLHKSIEQSDVVFLTGGVSVGDYDFVPRAAEQVGVNMIFHRIKQKPGKPLFFGKKENKYVIGLPGNPASVLTCFYEYALPCLEKMGGHDYALETVVAPLGVRFTKPAGLTWFLKGHYDGATVMPLEAQESYRLRSFARANCLVKIDEDITECCEGTKVEIHLLPDN